MFFLCDHGAQRFFIVAKTHWQTFLLSFEILLKWTKWTESPAEWGATAWVRESDKGLRTERGKCVSAWMRMSRAQETRNSEEQRTSPTVPFDPFCKLQGTCSSRTESQTSLSTTSCGRTLAVRKKRTSHAMRAITALERITTLRVLARGRWEILFQQRELQQRIRAAEERRLR